MKGKIEWEEDEGCSLENGGWVDSDQKSRPVKERRRREVGGLHKAMTAG